jgi:hypothetical protein
MKLLRAAQFSVFKLHDDNPVSLIYLDFPTSRNDNCPMSHSQFHHCISAMENTILYVCKDMKELGPDNSGCPGSALLRIICV